MKSIYFNNITYLGGFVKEPSSLEIKVEDTFDMIKTLQEEYGETQKTNSYGEPLYYKDIYNIKTHKELIGKIETIKETEEKVMEKYHKTNVEGAELYLENVLDEHGEIVDSFETTSPLSADGRLNTPIILERHKKTTEGQFVYYEKIYKDVEVSHYERTEETTEVTDKPVIVKVYKDVVYQLSINPEKFTLQEVLTEKCQQIINRSKHDYIMYDMFLDEDIIETPECCNLGVGLISINANSSISLKQIELKEPAKTLELVEPLPSGLKLYINTKLITDGLVTLAKPCKAITIKITNTTSEPVNLTNLGIMYTKEVE